MSESRDPTDARATALPLMLGSLAAAFFALFMILVTGGFFFYVVLAGACLFLVGTFHYLLWGKALDDEVAREREEMRLFEKTREQEQRPGRTYRR